MILDDHASVIMIKRSMIKVKGIYRQGIRAYTIVQVCREEIKQYAMECYVDNTIQGQ